MIEDVSEISGSQLPGEAQRMLGRHYRFVTATCVDLGNDDLEVLYHFDRELALSHFRLRIKRGEELPSISRIYPCSVLVENEMKELFGLNVIDMTTDYGGHMLLAPEALKHPMSKVTVERKGEQ